MIRGIHWFRRDLRLRDNAALNALAERAEAFLPVFVVDPRLVGEGAREMPRVRFLFDCLERLGAELDERGIPLVVREGRPEEVIPKLMKDTGATLLSFGSGVSPFACRRDERVAKAVARQGGDVLTRQDDVVLADGSLRSQSGDAYRVYTPYRNAWWKRFDESAPLPAAGARLPAPIPGFEGDRAPVLLDRSLEETRIGLPTGGERAARRRLATFLETGVERYATDRDRPDLDGTSRLSPYLRFGAISARQCVASALEARNARPALRPGVAKWLDEIVWREFYADLLRASPRLLSRSWRPEYDAMEWDHDPEGLAAWAEGRTGFPIVDAGMRQLRQTGWMHNRVRMIVASFLTKDLLIDWREGARVFLDLLVDGDPASNAGGWQWAASTGADAQPYFRIFNPVSQGRRYDPEGRYVRKYVPELRRAPDAAIHAPWEMERPPRRYPSPIVDHAARRRLALERFGRVRSPSEER